MPTSQVLKLITAICETVLAVPVLWWTIVLSWLWLPLWVMLVLHIITLVFCVNEKEPIKWNISWIATSVLWFIPFLWMILHIVSAVLLWIDLSQMMDKSKKEESK